MSTPFSYCCRYFYVLVWFRLRVSLLHLNVSKCRWPSASTLLLRLRTEGVTRPLVSWGVWSGARERTYTVQDPIYDEGGSLGGAGFGWEFSPEGQPRDTCKRNTVNGLKLVRNTLINEFRGRGRSDIRGTLSLTQDRTSSNIDVVWRVTDQVLPGFFLYNTLFTCLLTF